MMSKTKKNRNLVISTLLAATMVLTTVSGVNTTKKEAKAGEVKVKAEITGEVTAKRSRFIKQFAMSDGSFTAVTYSMPAHYKKNGKWKEIDTTLKKAGKKNYRTKSTDLAIRIAKKLNKKSVISLKRGSSKLSFALTGNGIKKAKAKITNPKKTKETDVLNQNTVTYKKAFKNTKIVYNIFPERIQEIITVAKKQNAQKWTFKIGSGKLKVKVKGKKVYFKTKKGKAKYTRLQTVLTDNKGVSTTNVKVSYNKKNKTLTVSVPKKWWNSKKRQFPIDIRTSYVTDKHNRNVKVGAAYSGAQNANYVYDKSLLLKANKCVGFVKMSNLAEWKTKNIEIHSAKLYVKNEKALKLGAGKTFDVNVHKVKEKWTSTGLTYNKRPAYESEAVTTFSIQKKKHYACDITDIVEAWYEGEANYGLALVADNTNRNYQAEIGRNPYVTINYEVLGFEGAAKLTEQMPVTRAVVKAGGENYYYFEGKEGVAYDIYTDSTLDTQASLYDADRERIDYADDSGVNKNFMFTGTYTGKKYLKVSVKDKKTGEYTLFMKPRFEVPKPTGIKGQDTYTITWNAVKNAKEYLICIYDCGKKIGEAVVTGTSYDYVYTNATIGKTLGFTVTARESASLKGESSHMIYNTDSQSDWVYVEPMQEQRKNASAVAADGKIYVLGGETEAGTLKTFEVYDTEKKTWEPLSDYPGTVTGICKATMIAYENEIYVIGGQTDTGMSASVLESVYAFDTETKKWAKKADLAEGRTNLATAVCDGKVYAFSKAGETQKIDVYDLKTDTWESAVMPGTSAVLGAISVDNRIFVLREDGESMRFSEYLPYDNAWEEEGSVCPYGVSDKYGTPAVISGKIYMAKESETKEVLVYDAYTDEWSRLSDTNLNKSASSLVSSENDIYSIGGELTGFGVLSVVERYTIDVKTIRKQMLVNKGESYELQVVAGNLKKSQTQVVTLSVDPDALEIVASSSFEETEGVTLLKYQPKKGVMVLKLTGNEEKNDSYEAYESVPVEAKTDGKTTIEMTLTEA